MGVIMDEEIREKVQNLIENAINPAIAGHGGFVDLLDVKDKIVYLAMGGGCQGCGMADVTLRHGIEALLRDEIPEIAEVVDATDHTAGENPFYSPAKG
jgi:Fe/S biogenesis protein NfuA